MNEAKYYLRNGEQFPINITDHVKIIDEISVESLRHVDEEAREARLIIDLGESESIAHLYESQKEMLFCTCDQAATKLIGFMQLEDKSLSFEKTLRKAGYKEKNLYPRHHEKTFCQNINQGKALRIQYKKLT